jgi:hypothetical protein
MKSLLLITWLAFHPVHVTVTSIDFVPSKDIFTVFLRMYMDDFLRDIKLSGAYTGKADFTVINDVAFKEMGEYLDRRLVLNVNSNNLKRKILDMKIVENELSMTMEYTIKRKPKIVMVKNTILTGLYSDQSNMVILRVDDFEEGFKLTPEVPEQTFKIK